MGAAAQGVGEAARMQVERDLKEAGLPPLAWYDALLELHRARPDGLRPGDLQTEMLLPQYNVSRLVDRLEAAGYAVRRPHPADGRGQVLQITEHGDRPDQSACGRFTAARSPKILPRKLNEGDAEQLAALLQRLSCSVRAISADVEHHVADHLAAFDGLVRGGDVAQPEMRADAVLEQYRP